MPKYLGHPSVVRQMILCSLLHVSRTSSSINREVALLELDGQCGATTVSSTLSQLVKEGLVNSWKVDAGSKTVEYCLTQEGRNRCVALLRSYEDLIKRGKAELERRIERDSIGKQEE